MPRKETANNPGIVDKGLVGTFLKMSLEERVQANDNAARTIFELRHAHKQQRNDTSVIILSGAKRVYNPLGGS